MNPDLRNRIVLPILLPILVLVGVGLAVGGIALILLFTSRVLALTIALIAATGIMVAVALANAIDEQDMTIARRGAIVMAGALPLVLGAAIALWSVNGGVPEDELNINRQPVISAPEGAVVGAKNDQSFCAFAPEAEQTEANCEDTSELTLPGQDPETEFRFLFVNLQNAIQHNLQIFELAGDASAPEAGEELFGAGNGSALITGPAQQLYAVPADVPIEPGGQYYYNCIVHPVMNGVLTIGDGEGEGEGADGATAEDG